MFFDAKQAAPRSRVVSDAPRLLRFFVRRRAIAAARRRVCDEPLDPKLHVDLAELLAEDGQQDEALEAYLLASHLFAIEGRAEEALDASVQTCRFYPDAPEVWLEAADAYVRQARTVEAVHCLIGGACFQLEHRHWDFAVDLLQHAARLAPAPLRDMGAGCEALAEESPWRDPLLALARAAERSAEDASLKSVRAG